MANHRRPRQARRGDVSRHLFSRGSPHESARIAARGLPSESRDLREVIAVIGNRRNQIAPDAGRRPDPGHEDNVVTLAFDGDGDPVRGKRAEGSGFEGESATGEGG
jgi:hypothetical protein